MNFNDLQNPNGYVYVRVLTALSNKFKTGDYVRMGNLDYHYEDDDEDTESKMMWMPTQYPLFSYRSRFDWNKSKDVMYEPIFQVTKAFDGYIEVKLVKPTLPAELNQQRGYHDYEFDITSHSLKDTVDNYLDEMDMSGVDLDQVVEAFLKHYVRIDDNYSDSIIFETEYIPYSNKEMDEKIEEAKRLLELQNQESVRLTERALKGHATRRRKRAEFLKQSAKISKSKKVTKKVAVKRKR